MELWAPKEYCTCSLLAGEADPSVATWTLAHDWSPFIATAVADLVERAEADVILWATWCGDPAPNRKTTMLKRLIEEIEAHRIANRTEYLVRRPKAR